MSDFWSERERLREKRRQMRANLREEGREMRARIREELRSRRNGNGPRFFSSGSASVHLIVGLVVVVLGVLFLLSNLHIFELRSPMRYFWSAVFLSIGIAFVIEHRNERMWQWGIGWILLGLWSFAHTSGWIYFDIWDLFWPVLLLAVGGYLVRRALTDGDGPTTFNSNSPNDPNAPRDPNAPIDPSAPRPGGRTIRGIGVLSGSELKPSAQSMDRAELFALMGGVKLDLYDAQLTNDAATINVGACMGGIEILVPSEWTVVSNVLPLMGAFIDKRRPAALGTTPRKVLTINGFVLMGGIEIKN